MSWGEITDQALAAAAELIGQPLRRSRMQWIEAATFDAIRHFAWGIGDDNPLWLDRDYAAASPAGTLLAPPCMLYAVDATIVAPKLPGVQWIYAGTEWTWLDHIRLGDSFRVEAELTGQEIKSGRRFARWVLQTGEVHYFNQHDRLIATAIGKCARTPRHASAKSENHAAAKIHHYQPEELAEIERQVLAEARQGAQPLYWEDVNIGDAVPPVIKGPLTITDIVAWYAATQGALHYGGAHGVRCVIANGMTIITSTPRPEQKTLPGAATWSRRPAATWAWAGPMTSACNEFPGPSTCCVTGSATMAFCIA